MRPIRRRLPGLDALAVFESAGRHLSFSRAAAELHVSQGAVSRRIQKLESRVGTALFRRGHRSIELTDDGRRYHQAVTLALEHIARATDELGAAPDSSVTIAATVAVSSLWLMPRMAALRAHLPGLEMQVLAIDSELEDIAGGFDVGIRYGTPPWRGMTSRPLAPGIVYPVCSPAYLRDRAPPAGAADLLGERLLYQEDARRDWMSWPRWFQRLGIAGPYPKPALRANSYPLLVQAAIDAQGIALGWAGLVDAHVEAGTLIPACDVQLETGQGFFLVTPEGAPGSTELAALAEWIVQRWT